MVILYLKVKAFQLREQCHVLRSYYSNIRFAIIDLIFGCCSFFLNPYRSCRKWLQKQREPIIDVYGETPLQVFDKLTRLAGVSEDDTFVEMGCGRGKLCFWAALFIGCNVRGIEWVPSFIRLAKAISWVTRIPILFERKSMFTIDLSNANAVYLYAIHFSDEQMRRLMTQFEKMPKNSIVISIGEPLVSTQFVVEHVVSARFAWGETEAYIQRRCKANMLIAANGAVSARRMSGLRRTP